MKAVRILVKAANALLSAAAVLFLITAGSYSAYALWDNAQVYSTADNVMSELLSLKPKPGAQEDNGASFEELLAVNGDVCAWLTLDGTRIDYPILQGEDNLSYINTDVYGSFALAGSIFLDSRCDNTFHDAYALVYGHHMDNGRMFGNLDKYKDGKFFGENSAGALILPDRSYKLEIFACMLVPAAEGRIFDTQMRQTDIGGLLDFAEAEAVHLRPDTVEAARGAESPQIIALSTCSSEYTDARTIVLAYMTPYTTETQVGG